MNKRDVLVGLVVGSVLGGVLGLLYAPRPGAETRAGAAEKAQALKEAAAERVRHLPVVILMPITINASRG